MRPVRAGTCACCRIPDASVPGAHAPAMTGGSDRSALTGVAVVASPLVHVRVGPMDEVLDGLT